jgi:hypothetical protein
MWWNLEYEEREKELQSKRYGFQYSSFTNSSTEQLQFKELELQRALDETSAVTPQQQKSWYRRLRFW